MNLGRFLSHDGALREIRAAVDVANETLRLARGAPPAQAAHLLRQVGTLQAGLSAVLDGIETMSYEKDEKALGEVLNYARRCPGIAFDAAVSAVGHGPRDTGVYADAAPWLVPVAR
jgi:hypothetical protein